LVPARAGSVVLVAWIVALAVTLPRHHVAALWTLAGIRLRERGGAAPVNVAWT
jgi:hypothetical protein